MPSADPPMGSSDPTPGNRHKSRWFALLECVFYGLCTGMMLLGGMGAVVANTRNSSPEAMAEEKPLGDCCGLAVDSKGTVFCATGIYGRVQAYSSGGIFLYGWNLPIDRNYAMSIDGEDRLHFTTNESQRHLVYDTVGRLLEDEQNPQCHDRWYRVGRSNTWSFTDRLGNKYRFGYNPLGTRVIKISPLGKKHSVVSQSLLLSLLSFPFPAIVFTHMVGPILVTFLALRLSLLWQGPAGKPAASACLH